MQIQQLSSSASSVPGNPTPSPSATPNSTATPAPVSTPSQPLKTSATYVGSNLVLNSGFENGFTPWETYSPTIEKSETYSGINSARFGGVAGGLTQRVSVVAGKTYRMEVWGKSEPNNGGAVVGAYMTLPDKSVQEFNSGIFSSNFQRYVTDFTVPNGVTEVAIRCWSNSGTGYSYVDDFSLREIIASSSPVTLSDEGDSISVMGTHSTLYSTVTSDLIYTDQAVGGSGMNSVESRKTMMLAKKPANGKWVVTLFIGANDLPGADPNLYAERVFAYTDQLRAAGAKVAVGTALPQYTNSKDAMEQKRAIYNQLLKQAVGVHIDAVIDYGGDPVLGAPTAPADTTLYSDGLHPTWGPKSGQEIMFLHYKEVVDKLISQM